jgi:hypothetical protein
MKDDPDDIADVRRADMHRGRRGAFDVEERAIRRRIAGPMLRALAGPLDEFRDAISALHEEGSPEYESLIRIWHEKHAPRAARRP